MNRIWPGLIILILFSNLLYSQSTRDFTEQELLLDKAYDLFQKEKYNPARSAFQLYSDNYEADADIDYYIGICALKLLHGDGVEKLRRFMAENPESQKNNRINFELGLYFYQKGGYNEALAYFSKTKANGLEKDEIIELNFKKAYSHFTQQEFEQAAPLFTSTKAGIHKYSSPSYYYSGIISYKSEDYDKAERDFESASKDDNYKNLIPELLANIYYKQQRYDDLEKIGEEVLKNRGVRNKKNIYMMLGDAFYEKEDFEKAYEYFDEYLGNRKVLPKAEISFRFGYSAFQLEKYDDARKYLEHAAFRGEGPMLQNASYYLARVYLLEENLTYAENAFEKASKDTFDLDIQEEAVFALAKLKFDSKFRSQSIELFQAYMDKYPKGKFINEANQFLSEAFLTSNNYDAAIKHIEALPSPNRRIRATYQKVCFYKGVENFNDRKFQQAIVSFDKSLKEIFDKEFQIQSYFWKGEALSILNEFSKAANAYSGVFRNSDKPQSEIFLKSRYGIAYAYFNNKEYSKAKTHFIKYTQALENADDKLFYGDALVRLADCYLVLKDNSSAYQYYKKALVEDSKHRDYTRFRLGVVSWFLGNKLEGQRYLKQVIDDHKNSIFYDDALYEYANIEFESGSYAAAISGFTNLINQEKISPFLPYAYLNRAIANRNLNQNEASVNDYMTIIDQYVSHSTATDALTGLQEALHELGRDDEYDIAKKKFLAANPESDAVISLDFEGARKKYFAGNYAGAIKSFSQYIKDYGQNSFYPDLSYYLAESYYLNGEKDSARKYYEEVLKISNTDFLNKSILRIADMHFDETEYEEAIPKYSLLKHLARNRNEEILAWQGLMNSYYNQNNYDTASSYALLIVERGEAAFGARNKALLLLGKAARAENKIDKAEEYFEECISAGQDVNAAEAKFNIAEMRSEIGAYQESVDASLDLIAKYSSYPIWLDNAFILIAENFIKMEEFFQARSTLESIIANSPSDETVNRAKELLEDLQEIENAQELIEIENDSIGE